VASTTARAEAHKTPLHRVGGQESEKHQTPEIKEYRHALQFFSQTEKKADHQRTKSEQETTVSG